MDESEFIEMLRLQGYEGPEIFSMGSNEYDTEHTHKEETIALIVEGSIVIEKPSGDVNCNVGDIVSYPAGEPHTEKAGPNGVKALCGWRDPIG